MAQEKEISYKKELLEKAMKKGDKNYYMETPIKLVFPDLLCIPADFEIAENSNSSKLVGVP